jgi:transposase
LKKTYPIALREEAVNLVLTQDLSLEQAAASVSIPKGTLANGVATARRSPSEATPPGSRTAAELEAENAKLRKELAATKVERDIVKNRPTRPSVALMNRNSRRVHWLHAGLWP